VWGSYTFLRVVREDIIITTHDDVWSSCCCLAGHCTASLQIHLPGQDVEGDDGASKDVLKVGALEKEPSVWPALFSLLEDYPVMSLSCCHLPEACYCTSMQNSNLPTLFSSPTAFWAPFSTHTPAHQLRTRNLWLIPPIQALPEHSHITFLMLDSNQCFSLYFLFANSIAIPFSALSVMLSHQDLVHLIRSKGSLGCL
jgi:hypothetical protein